MFNPKNLKYSGIKIWGLMLFLVAFACLCLVLNSRFAREASLSDLKGGVTVFEKMVFCVKNEGQTISTKAYKDITVNPTVYCVFLPSCSKGKEIFIYFELRDIFTLISPDGTEYVLKSGDKLPDIELKKEYDLCMTGGYDENYDYTKIAFYRSDDMASVFIDTESGDMEYLDSDKENREKGKILILNEEGGTEYKGKLDEIKGHGNSTWMRAKKPYGLKLYNKRNLFNMGSSKNWILLSNSMDLSMMRNSLIDDIAHSLDLPASPELHYVDLYLNGKYNGLYTLSSKTEIAENRLNITDLDLINKSLNLTPPSGAEQITDDSRKSGLVAGIKLDVLPEDITGGYLIEHDYGAKFNSEPSRFTTTDGDRYVLRSPAYAPIEEVRYIADIFDELERRAKSGGDLSDLIDLKSFARIYVLDEFTRNEGAGVTSAYYYKDKDSSDPLVYAGPIWDYDQCLGNTYFPIVNEPRTLNFCTDHLQSTHLFYELYMNHPEFREEAMRYYKDEFRPCMAGFLETGFDSYLNKVLSDNDMNNRRWGNDDKAIEDSVIQAEDFIRERLEFLDKVWIDREKIKVLHFDNGRGRDFRIGVLEGSSPPESVVSLETDLAAFDQDNGDDQ